ncbi:MAG: hypothetical protein ACE5MH_09080 [Terriglobia bacterium]
MAGSIVQPKSGPVEARQRTRRRTPQRTLDAIIRRAVLRELRRQQGNLSRTAQELGIARQTLLNYLDSWKLKVRDGGRTLRVLPWEKRWYEARQHTRKLKPKGWTNRDTDMVAMRHGNSDELAWEAEQEYWEMMNRL